MQPAHDNWYSPLKTALIGGRHVFFVALIILLLLPGCGGSDGENDSPRSFENGRAEKTASGTYWVLDLAGSWLEMGRQYGGLMGPELRRFHTEITRDVIARGISEEEQKSMATEVISQYSSQLQELLLGISQTSGLSYDETLVLNAGMMLLTNAVLGGEPPSACSGIAVWDGYTRDGTLIFGRNWDIDRKAMSRYMRYLAVVVLHPLEGNALANIHPLGNVYLETGMNNRGLFIELNNGEYSDPTVHEEREDTSSVLVTVLNQSDTVQQAAALLKSIPADVSYILQIADLTHAVSLERPTFDTRVRPADDHGLVIAYNSFVPPYPAHWRNRVAPPKPSDIDPRYDNMLRMAQSPAYKGLFTPQAMMTFLEVPMEEGGAYHTGTVVQVVAVPAERTIWIRGCDYADWERVPLAGYFDGRQ
ncbi:C45 family autoproteolytic acyltransferase/hydolase [Desulfonatronovibrio magnus]|uniref:C45 family autoproteolytic acyltransferase/hydolase n=1 Tax=Desulfonatronovibrio magnus TaxID=698827 RepID=UPI0005EB1905|nr:C45 family peptidase [Desulfonatronovibrio magnus]